MSPLTPEAGSDRGAAVDPAQLLPVVRRVIAAKMGNHPDAEDLVQEAIARVLENRDRIEPGMSEAYAVTTARNLMTSVWRDTDRFARHKHRFVDHEPVPDLDEGILARTDRSAMTVALEHLDAEDRELLQAHEVEGLSLSDLASARSSSTGAIGARLHRIRRRLRVEYLIAMDGGEPPTPDCRPVLLAYSARDRRRQNERDSDRHVFGCDFCTRVGAELVAEADGSERVRLPISTDPDIVSARQAAREVAQRIGLSRADQTLVATAVSEITRNIVRFGQRGEVIVEAVTQAGREGIRVSAMDHGPGISNLDEAMRDGFSSYGGLGLGLPGARRVMDDFEIDSAPDRGTCIRMTKWRQGR